MFSQAGDSGSNGDNMHGVITVKKAARLRVGKKHFRNVALAFVMISAAGCALTPEPITPEERAALVSTDRRHLFENQEPVTGPISLEEAIARAIKYNYDYRLTAMDQALQNRQLDLSRYDMLPKLAASAAGTARSNENLTVSENTRTGVGPPIPRSARTRNAPPPT